MSVTKDEVAALTKELWDFSKACDRERGSDVPIDWDARDRVEQELWERVRAMDRQAGKGLQVGRLLSFPIADGRAHYLVHELHPRTVEVVHVPLFDAWHVGDIVSEKGRVARRVAEQNIRRSDSLVGILREAEHQEED